MTARPATIQFGEIRIDLTTGRFIDDPVEAGDKSLDLINDLQHQRGLLFQVNVGADHSVHCLGPDVIREIGKLVAESGLLAAAFDELRRQGEHRRIHQADENYSIVGQRIVLFVTLPAPAEFDAYRSHFEGIQFEPLDRPDDEPGAVRDGKGRRRWFSWWQGLWT